MVIFFSCNVIKVLLSVEQALAFCLLCSKKLAWDMRMQNWREKKVLLIPSPLHRECGS